MNAPTPRQFVLRRDHDVTGVSGPGDVADGVQWPDGSVALRWRERPSTSVWDSLDLMLSVHGHDGATRVVWRSEDTIPVADHLEAACRAQQEIERLRGAAGRAYLLADRWEAAHGSAGFLVRAAGTELRDVLDEDAGKGCENTSHRAHVGFTCAEADESKPYWNVRWAQEHTAASRESGPGHDDWRRRAEQAEDLLRVAHETSNRSETERARAVKGAEAAEELLRLEQSAAAGLARKIREQRQVLDRVGHERDVTAADLATAEQLLAEARQWARHGYEIGQRHCGWSDHGVAPAWLTEGWPPHIESCEHLRQMAEYDEALTRVRAVVSRWAPQLLPRSEAHRLLTDLRAALDGTEQPAASRACPHCPDGHQAPTGGSQPWGVWVGPERDGDGQPTTIHIARSAGAHVAESDAEWMRHVLNHLPASETYCTLPHEMEA